MKKIFILFTLLILFVSNGLQAQENTYNMVIEMANGTKISIGPNDVKNVTFNDGQLVVTGEDLLTWMANTNTAIMLINKNAEDNDKKVSTLQTEVYAWQTYFESLNTSMDVMKANMINANNQITTLNTNAASYSASINELKALIEQLNARVAALEQGKTEPEKPSVVITVTTYDASDVAETSATLNGSVSASNTTKSYTAGFFLSTSGTPSSSNNTKKVEAGSNKTANYTASVTGLTENTTYRYRAYVLYDGEYYYGETASFTTKEADHTKGVLNGHEWVDLGLPSGTKWATCNVGASNPEDYGGYYAWGETEERSTYYIQEYKFFDYRDANYNYHYKYVATDISGTSYDVAHVKWGSEWQMPTKKQINELVDNCSVKWMKQGNSYGCIYTGNNGNSIFLPAAGYKGGDSCRHRNEEGNYWTSTSEYGYASGAEEYYFTESHFGTDWSNGGISGFAGLSVRPVCVIK